MLPMIQVLESSMGKDKLAVLFSMIKELSELSAKLVEIPTMDSSESSSGKIYPIFTKD